MWRTALLVEITWFWAHAGTLQGLITPDHPIAFPSYDWFECYGDHILVVLAALLLVVGLRLHPRAGAALRVIAFTVAFIALMGVVDGLTGGNYDYLRQAAPGSLLVLLGTWPWYILGATGLGLVFIVIFDLPFWPERPGPGSAPRPRAPSFLRTSRRAPRAGAGRPHRTAIAAAPALTGGPNQTALGFTFPSSPWPRASGVTVRPRILGRGGPTGRSTV